MSKVFYRSLRNFQSRKKTQYAFGTVAEDGCHELGQHERLTVLFLSANCLDTAYRGEWYLIELQHVVGLRVVLPWIEQIGSQCVPSYLVRCPQFRGVIVFFHIVSLLFSVFPTHGLSACDIRGAPDSMPAASLIARHDAAYSVRGLSAYVSLCSSAAPTLQGSPPLAHAADEHRFSPHPDGCPLYLSKGAAI